MNTSATATTRLQKYLSDAGVASRRHAEEMILEGRVRVNGRVVMALPVLIDPATDEVMVDGVRVRPQRLEYYLVHKPRGVLCTNNDPDRRVRAVDLLPPAVARLFPVGRLDADSTGLLLLTNDGELAERLTHPRYGVPKTYRAEVRGRVPADLPERLRRGVHLAEGKAQASEVEITHASNERSVLMITLREGRNRQVRRMLARFGFPVRTLKRVQIGPLSLRGLPSGACRRLTPAELDALRHAVANQPAGRRGPGRRRQPTKTAPTPKREAAAGRPSTGSPPAKPRRRLIT